MAEYNTPKRKKIIKSYLSDDEKKLFDSYLEETTLTQAEYIRKSVLQKSFRINRIERKEIPLEEFKEILRLLGNLTGNMNQIAHRMNENNLISYQELKNKVADIDELKDMINEVVKKHYGDC